jgi:hypothetical protein
MRKHARTIPSTPETGEIGGVGIDELFERLHAAPLVAVLVVVELFRGAPVLEAVGIDRRNGGGRHPTYRHLDLQAAHHHRFLGVLRTSLHSHAAGR